MMSGLRIIISFNDWEHEVNQLNAFDKDWITTNTITEYVSEPLFTDELVHAPEVEDNGMRTELPSCLGC